MENKESSSTDRIQKRRARTGCLRCRTRRRKCDEGKPRCQRCVDAEAECVYGQRVSFLQKNAFTLSSDADDRAVRQKDAGRSEESSTSTAHLPPNVGERTGAHHVVSPNGGTKATPSASSRRRRSPCRHSDASFYDSGEKVDDVQNLQAQNGASSHVLDDHTHEDTGTSHGDSYEIALDVLMNLGTGDPSINTQTPAPPTCEDHAEDECSPVPSILKSIDGFGPASVNVQHQLSSGRTIELLRHYRYKIAPWLDMCDTNQTLGLVIPHLATRSDVSFDALLGLCATSYAKSPGDRESNHDKSVNGGHITDSTQYSLEHSKLWEVKLWSILTAARGFLIDPPQSWDGALANNRSMHVVYSQVAEGGPLRQVNRCILWLLARFGIAVALLNDSTSIVDSSIVEASVKSSSSERDDSIPLEILHAYESLVLCTKALEFSYLQEETSNLSTEPRPRAFRWKAIVNSLNDWHTNRPSAFRPVIELDSAASPFPTLYFTSGAGTLGNQLYHTAMMLMLAHKPRTLHLDQRRSSSLSQLWHAQRICGIAVNNNRRECWDPCLLASFYLAARHMTHEAQQREILMGFSRVAALGWHVDGFVERLRQEWLI
ncbi:hypothetical protein TgHK011_008677 [Trichoderma gracile]|nr:hypothetical protein TgHK011_008677 [Trichoderma gracile]